MSLTRLFIKRPTLVFVLLALMAFFGTLSVATIVRQLFPNVSQPTVSINVQYPGASTSVMRDNIVQPIEQNLAGTTDLQTINSVVQSGQATISAIFNLNSDTAADLVNTQKAVQLAERNLPANIATPTVTVRDPSEATVVTLALRSQKLSLGQLSLYASNVIGPQIQQIPGVSYANVGGAVTPAYEVQVDPFRLEANGLTLNDVIDTVANDNQRVPGGIAYEPNRETTIDVRGDIQTPESIAHLAVVKSGSSAAAPGGSAGATSELSGGLAGLPGSVDPWTASNAIPRIADVARVVAGYEPQRTYAQIDGRPGLFLQVQKTSDASEVTSSDNVVAALPMLRRRFPDVQFEVVNVQSRFTAQQIDSVLHSLLEGIALTAIAMLFFLRSWRNAVVVCVAIPTSLAIALSAMKLLGLTIDTISMLGMTLVIGILVDDSTVVLENIERHYAELGQPPEEAAVQGREEIGAAAVVITLVDVVVFLPIAFIQSQVGKNLVEFGIVVVISTLTSLFISFTVTPTLAGLWSLRSTWKPPGIIDAFGRQFDRLRDWYAHRALLWALRHARLVAALCALSFVASIALVPLGVVGEEFIPATDRGELFLQVVYPLGTPLSRVRDGAQALERQIDQQRDVAHEFTVSGAYAASFGGFVVQGNVGQIHVFLADGRKHSTDWWVGRFREMARQAAPGAQTVVVPVTGSGGGNAQPIDELVTDVAGGDPTSAALRVLDILRGTPGAASANSSGTSLAPQVAVEFDRDKAQALDVDIGQAATAAGAAFGGDVATQFETPQGLEQVQVIYPLADQHQLDALRAIPIRANDGSIVHLGDFTTFALEPTSPLITRTDRNTVIHVDANVAPGYSLSNVQAAFAQRIAAAHLPSNILVRPAPLGQQDFMRQTLSGLGASMVLSIVLVFLLMVALYNSYLSPLIILFSVPVAAAGAIGALLLTHSTLNLFSLIGSILLIGIATKNGILLVDYANTLRGRGLEELEAIKQSAFTRFRPIVMTSISVVAANVPLALALEPGQSSRASLGIVVIGGVMSSLVLTLLLIPIMYLWLAPKQADRSAPPQEPQPALEGTVREPALRGGT
ncbi:MAG: efflux RND transporter permease subunit [Candidatus Baltobacteraceae bacterium]